VSEKPRASIDLAGISRRLIANVEQVVVGKRQQIAKLLVAWYCEGHVLLEDVPGVAKTILARAFARSVSCTFRRVQCTPDLLPTDVTGGAIFNQKTSEFEFRPGPIFSQVVLADEINRATPRTQAAFLEAMAESSVTMKVTQPHAGQGDESTLYLWTVPANVRGTWTLDGRRVRIDQDYQQLEVEGATGARMSGADVSWHWPQGDFRGRVQGNRIAGELGGKPVALERR
jgi:hypothetical protein